MMVFPFNGKTLICLRLGIILFLLSSCVQQADVASKILIISGGHSFDTLDFYKVFDRIEGFEYDTISQPEANRLISRGGALKYDALVFYDSWQDINENEKQSYLDLCEKGVEMLFLHHSLVSYQQWDEFTEIRGGRYPKSVPPDTINDGRYRHDIDLMISVTDSSHFITKGMRDFIIHDEGYSNVIYGKDIEVLLTTNDPDCSEIIAWTHKYKNSKIVYLMGGHDKIAYENPNFRKLVENSLNYLKSKQ